MQKKIKLTHAVREHGAFILLNPDGTYSSCKEAAPGAEAYLIEAGVASMTI